MQSKPTPIATLGNELNIDDVPSDKLTSSGSFSSGAMQQQQHQHGSAESAQTPQTEILFKTKSNTEMKRIFGLLQWKNSLNYDNVSEMLKFLLTKANVPNFSLGLSGQTAGRAAKNCCQYVNLL